MVHRTNLCYTPIRRIFHVRQPEFREEESWLCKNLGKGGKVFDYEIAHVTRAVYQFLQQLKRNVQFARDLPPLIVPLAK